MAETHDRTARVTWEEGRAANLANWEERVPIHEVGYGIADDVAPDTLSRVVRDDLMAMAPFLPGGSVDGLDLCHLQCHIGTDTVSFARVGARVTGVDFSPAALASAARLAERRGLTASWVETDVLDAAAALRSAASRGDVPTADFDVVYTSIGAICWLDDLDRWAAQIAGILRPGGLFYIRDGHPAMYALDENAPELRTTYRYFGDGAAQVWDDAGTYAGEGTITSTRTYEWPHPLSEVVNAVIGAGLRVERLDEGTVVPWQFSPRMESVDGGFAWPEPDRARMPVTFSLTARMP
ncbi:Methyltransferase type 12 [Xylanimonas cellulosilytica DSM 15894]|uniref:Methyltransferase type 12 n=1 Tax=Xylanimonas cellulosilytica (strain DSM 15894 / JCM 12276 / CECT 5975 / KCTC 9989 / LMG 20990 / NBRC 107835 / XIL07) TaxID=446471 RepID=D1BTG8_XYLCX|nr:class I SAM-dependent methyltransferase [Xylanimonas cellulosilytica]ACZ30947.1 Methyltransferase type 12 [Xylanimonas cellulosilytica DSM 15894]